MPHVIAQARTLIDVAGFFFCGSRISRIVRRRTVDRLLRARRGRRRLRLGRIAPLDLAVGQGFLQCGDGQWCNFKF